MKRLGRKRRAGMEEKVVEGGGGAEVIKSVERAILRHGPYPSYRELIIFSNQTLAPGGRRRKETTK